ncbi:hypothetical protein [Paenibacillus sp. CGMCC 1.18879]|uniref:hypothetical protein n=1 Tax=Paenibacillus sp. CGMCC 1.18879 TaxID=2834466 RepID=UPI001CA889E5|nr:hypothetical protein [Paenibacillus sp. CGMCC 1.18879]MBY9077000.1 hypothetical protein [Paenibacillus sp. CGMCC 1.18879]
MKNKVIITLISLLIQTLVIVILIIIDPTPFVDGFIVTSGLLFAPIASMAYAGIIIILVKKKKSQMHLLVVLPICSILLISQLQPYYTYLDHRRSEYTYLLSIKYSDRKGYNVFDPISISNQNFGPEDEIELTTLLNNHISKKQVISRLQLDENEPIVWIEILKPSLFKGSSSEFAFYNIQNKTFSNFISDIDVFKVLIKHGYSRVNFFKRDAAIYKVFINDINNKKNEVIIVKSNDKLIIK